MLKFKIVLASCVTFVAGFVFVTESHAHPIHNNTIVKFKCHHPRCDYVHKHRYKRKHHAIKAEKFRTPMISEFLKLVIVI